MLESQLKNLKVVLEDAERRQAASEAGAKQLSTGQRYIQEISELKQQVISFAHFYRAMLSRARLCHAKSFDCTSATVTFRSDRAKTLS